MAGDTHTILIRPNGAIIRSGWDDGAAEIEVHYRTSTVLVLKVGGHSYWSGVGQQSYAGAHFYVYTITSVSPDAEGKRVRGETLVCTRVTDFPLRKEKPRTSRVDGTLMTRIR